MQVRVTAYDDLGNNVARTNFSTYTVYSNWDANNAYDLNGNTLPPAGVVTQANDGSVIAGVFTAYNGKPLSDGDHYLLEVRSPTEIKLFQPIGANTDIHVHIEPTWNKVTVAAYAYDGKSFGAVTANMNADYVDFDYASVLNGMPVGYYQINPES